ncbi:hypothetical protein T11_6742 [Trichinella zimbabwensis]|uniref:Uncharacterized protein n=1 Tax=Trichinella zimbabwensis TaxID=268475 RepID=A0A0V1GER8_9BILA|nr:hypothetical protein T11_6742 [Trichinella zimbabwensis]
MGQQFKMVSLISVCTNALKQVQSHSATAVQHVH